MKNSARILLILFAFAGMTLSSCKENTLTELEKLADIIVAQDGSGNYSSVMEAIDQVPENSQEETVIYIRKGIYYEKIIIPEGKNNLVLLGEDVDSTILTYDHHSIYTSEINTFTSHSVRVDANNVSFFNLTIENPNRESQAVALHGNGDKQQFIHCKILGWQDTYYSDMRSRNYFKDCIIEGATDYIFGFGIVVFDSCLINTLGYYVTAASTPEQYDFGMVFRNCRFTLNSERDKYSLGRPWFPYARTVIMNSYLADKLIPEGWSTWGGREEHCYYREYENYGPGSDTTGRIYFGKQLSKEEAKAYTFENIFSASNYPKDNSDYEIYLETRFVGHKNEPYLEDIVFRIDGDWPGKPVDDWLPDPGKRKIYNILYENVTAFLD